MTFKWVGRKELRGDISITCVKGIETRVGGGGCASFFGVGPGGMRECVHYEGYNKGVR